MGGCQSKNHGAIKRFFGSRKSSVIGESGISPGSAEGDGVFADASAQTKNVVQIRITKQRQNEDLKEIDELVKRYWLPRRSVYLMPEGIETQGMIDWSREVAEICKAKGYLLSTRVQVILYGPKWAV